MKRYDQLHDQVRKKYLGIKYEWWKREKIIVVFLKAFDEHQRVASGLF